MKELSIQHIDVIYELVRFKKYYPSIVVSNIDEPTATAAPQTTVNSSTSNEKQAVNPNTIAALWYFYDLVTHTSFNSFSTELK